MKHGCYPGDLGDENFTGRHRCRRRGRRPHRLRLRCVRHPLSPPLQSLCRSNARCSRNYIRRRFLRRFSSSSGQFWTSHRDFVWAPLPRRKCSILGGQFGQLLEVVRMWKRMGKRTSVDERILELVLTLKMECRSETCHKGCGLYDYPPCKIWADRKAGTCHLNSRLQRAR